MGTTSEKLTYLNETKTQLKGMINYGLDENNKITNEKTFRDYVKSIFKAFLESLNNPDTLFTNLPKKSGTGANITLNGTANAPMRIELSASEMSQSGTPTPESPQDIHTISGDNKLVVSNSDNTISQEADINLGDIEYCKIGNYEDEFIRTSGKNLFDSNLKQGGRLFSNGNYFNQANYVHNENPISVIPGETYTLSAKDYTPTSNSGFVFFKDGVFVSSLQQSNRTFTVPSNANQVYCDFNNGSNITPNDITEIQLEKGATATEYEPYGTNEWYIKKSIGKVVLDGSEMWGNSGAANTFYTTSITDYAISNNTPMSNYYSGVSNVTGGGGMSAQPNNTIAFINISGQITPRFYVKDRRYENTQYNDFKTWLSSNNLIVYYILTTPTYTPITGTLAEQLENIYQKLKSFKGTTNISQLNNDLPFVLNVQALEDLE